MGDVSLSVTDRGIRDYVFLFTCALAIILIPTGIGMPYFTALAGIAACVVGFSIRDAIRVDWMLLCSVAFYVVWNGVSAVAINGDVMQGYASIESIWPVLILLCGALSGGQRVMFRRFQAGVFGIAAATGILYFLLRPRGISFRLDWIMHNANAMAIFLVIGWFLMISPDTSGQDRVSRTLRACEPVVLAALGLTLSMGGFVSMAAGILVSAGAEYAASRSMEFVLTRTSNLLARAAVGIGTGILLYISVTRTDWYWLGWAVGVFILMLAACWDDCLACLSGRAGFAMAGIGVLIAVIAILLRPNATATFLERLDMIKNGLGYASNPDDMLFGIGPFNWRLRNLADSDKYYNTWHVHNALVHAAVEFGIPAMLAVLGMFVALFRRVACNKYLLPAVAAFACHCTMDTGFFCVGLTGFVLCTIMLSGDDSNLRVLPGWAAKLAFAVLGLFFAYVVLRMPGG